MKNTRWRQGEVKIMLALLFSVGGWSQDLPIPQRGRLSFAMPPPWKEVHRQSGGSQPPQMFFERTGNPRGQVELSVLWSPKEDPGATSEDRIRKLVLAGQRAIKENTLEKELPLQPIRGKQGTGFYYAATDKTYKAPQGPPTPGEFPILIHGELGLGTVILSFTIFSDKKGDKAVQEALMALSLATLQSSSK